MTEPTGQASEATARLDVAMERMESADQRISSALVEWLAANEEFRDALKDRQEELGAVNRQTRRAKSMRNPVRYDRFSRDMARLTADAYVSEAAKILEAVK